MEASANLALPPITPTTPINSKKNVQFEKREGLERFVADFVK